MDIRSLEAFTAVAEEQSFSSGADRLYISQSAASKYIRHLETELGVCLFDRTHRQIRLTPAGERMLSQAKALLSQYRSLLASVREETALHIAMLPVADSYGFAQLLADFSAGMPGQPLRLEERQNLSILRLLEENQLDGAFCRVLPPYPESRDCVLFRREELVLLVADEGQAESRVDLSRYRDRRFLFLEKSTGLWEASMALCQEAGFRPDVCYTGSARGNITRLVREGTGVALLAEGVAVQCLQEGVRMLHLNRSTESHLVFLCSRKGRALPGMMRLMSFLRDNAPRPL